MIRFCSLLSGKKTEKRKWKLLVYRRNSPQVTNHESQFTICVFLSKLIVVIIILAPVPEAGTTPPNVAPNAAAAAKDAPGEGDKSSNGNHNPSNAMEIDGSGSPAIKSNFK